MLDGYNGDRDRAAADLRTVARNFALAAYVESGTTDRGFEGTPDLTPSRVLCGTCLHFLPDPINRAQGIGRCEITETGLPPSGGTGYRACYPMAPRTCPDFKEILQ